MNEIKTEIIGLVAGILTASSMTPQLVKTIKMKEVKDIYSPDVYCPDSRYRFMVLLRNYKE